MRKKKEKRTGLSNNDKIMFGDFIDWVNLKQGKGTFLFSDPAFQAFKNTNGIDLDFKSPIPKRISNPNAIFYKSTHSAVYDLARHIRNAYSHSRIRKKKECFIMTDIDPKTKDVTMRGKISTDLMQGLLDAIRANKRGRKKKKDIANKD